MVRISESELEIMKVLWNKKVATSAEIIQELEKFRWSPNTIRTFINRLQNKKAIGISEKIGKVFLYVSLIDEKEYKKLETKRFVEQFFDGLVEEFVLCLVKSDERYCEGFCEFVKGIDYQSRTSKISEKMIHN